jgi:hypothetical protein
MLSDILQAKGIRMHRPGKHPNVRIGKERRKRIKKNENELARGQKKTGKWVRSRERGTNELRAGGGTRCEC